MYNGNAHLEYDCCGGCELHVPEIQVLYWSTSSQLACSPPNTTRTSDAILLLSSNGTQMPTNWGQSDLATYTVLDGSTLTFPSTYLIVHGPVSVRDRCGVRGKTYTNPTIAVPQGGLSTVSFGYGKLSTGSYDPAACRTWGYSNGSTTWLWEYDGSGSSSWVSSLYFSPGPPYNPVLLPPPQLTALDPEWQACTLWRNLDNDYGDAIPEGLGYIFDPPRALARASAIVDPSITKPDPAPQPTHSSPQPAGSIPPPAPRVTDRPTTIVNSALSTDPSPDPVESDKTATLNAHPETKSPEPASSGGDPTIAADPNPSEDASDPMTSDTDLAGFIIRPFQPIANEDHGDGDPATQTHIISLESSGFDPPILTIGENSYTANKASEYVVGSQTISAGGPAFHVNGVLYSLASPATTLSNIASTRSALSSNDEPVLTINGKPYTADSASQYIIGSQTLAPGGPTITVNNVPYALPASSAVIISDGSAIALGQKAAAADATLLSEPSAAEFDTDHQPQVYTVDGIQMTGDPSILAVGSATLSPGSPALTISGHTLSLANGGALVFDGRTSILTAADPSDNKQYQTYTVDDIRLTGNAAALTVGSATLTPGSPALTISAHTLSLATGGALVVDGRISSPLTAPGFGSTQPPIQTYTVNGGIPLTGNPTATLLVSGTTLRAGSPALTVSGHVFSLATGGTLVVDGRTTILSAADVSSLASQLDNGGDVVGTFSSAAATRGASVVAGGNGVYTGGTNRAAKARKIMLRILILLLVCVTVCIL